jgi:hypothetical protein
VKTKIFARLFPSLNFFTNQTFRNGRAGILEISGQVGASHDPSHRREENSKPEKLKKYTYINK